MSKSKILKALIIITISFCLLFTIGFIASCKEAPTEEALKEKASNTQELLKTYRKGDFEEVERLIEQGVNVNVKDIEGKTALIYAAERGHIEIAQLLIDNGVDIDAQDNEGITALGWAAVYSIEVAQLLIDNGADIDLPNIYGRTVLSGGAAWHGETEIAEMLIDNGADVNLKCNEGRTALSWAAEQGHTDIVYGY